VCFFALIVAVVIFVCDGFVPPEDPFFVKLAVTVVAALTMMNQRLPSGPRVIACGLEPAESPRCRR
jgi:hypothetical protein